MKNIRFGIIGYGAQGKTYASILTGKSVPGMGLLPAPKYCSLTAISDISSRPAKEFGKASGIAIFNDWKELIDQKACDAIILTVPHFLHPEITLYALEHGMHVLCEKPAAVRASDVEKMIAASKRHPDLTFALMLNQRLNPIYQKIKQMIGSGELGEIRRSSWIINTWWRPDSYYQSSSWRGTWKGEGGGLLVNQAPHQLDLWSWLCGQPVKLYAICREGAHRDIQVENDVTLLAEYANGSTGTFISCTHDPVGTDRLEIDLSKGKIIVDNSNKATVYRFNKDETDWNDTMEYRMFSSTLRRTPEELYSIEIIEGQVESGADYAMMFSNFAEHILNGTPLIAPGAEGLNAVQIANTAQLSAARAQPLPCPCDTAAYNEYLERRISEEDIVKPKPPIKNIGHVSFNGRNMEEMLHFYRDIVGMEVLFTSTYSDLYNSMKRRLGGTPPEEIERRLKNVQAMGSQPWVTYLKLADRQYLELFHPAPDGSSKKELDDRRDYYGYMKLNYEVDDIQEIRRRMVAEGIPLNTDVHMTADGSFEIAVHDPDGNEVQFTQYAPGALKKLGTEALPQQKESGSLARRTTQIALQVRAGAKMKKFYCDGLGLKVVRTLTYTDLLKTLENSEMVKNNSAVLEGMKVLGNLPWIDFLEVAPHQYIELFYHYGTSKKEERNLYPYYGYQHYCLEVNDIQKAWDAVIANGLTPDTPISKGADGSWQFWLVDPDGNRLEMMAYTPESKQLL